MTKSIILEDKDLIDLYCILTDWIEKQEIFCKEITTENIKELIKRAKQMKHEIGSELK